ncbi:membrane protein [Corynebacterium glutamicum]|uniref:GtrA family protein n=1 Tax=Corynebacterium glutamicum TaxID=1718 RepID=UPI0004F7858A|nr:GtrA family protein [Corynebacterium glutamicum]AIK84793.1 membrane protein [Corynebacterium glutamicum]AIK87577.1 membrane protein [Corynebacterium glutamicum]QDQ20595.1 GtrA family protein [Corynebacterium glutamicum]QDQ24161.1 GtrA family protein [Corynebacterium glutamicum]
MSSESSPESSTEQKTWGSRFLRASRQFIKFGIVGGSGTLVNLAVAALSKKVAGWTAGIHESDAFMNLLGSAFHIRWYHVFMTIAFLVANTWNYQLNRMWTFKTATIVSWWRGFFPFLATGLVAFIASQVVATLLMNETSPIALSSEIFDDSTGFRTKFYWALVISILVSMPVNFIVNKYWTFKKPKSKVVVETDPV